MPGITQSRLLVEDFFNEKDIFFSKLETGLLQVVSVDLQWPDDNGKTQAAGAWYGQLAAVRLAYSGCR